MNACFGVGAALGPAIAALTASVFGNALGAFVVVGILNVASGVVISRIEVPVSKQSDGGCAEQDTELDRNKVAPMSLLFLAVCGAEVAYANWIFTYTTEVVGATDSTAACMNTAYFVAFTGGRFLISFVQAPPQDVIRLMLALLLLCISCVLAFPRSLPMLWVGTIGGGFGVASLFAQAMLLLSNHTVVTGKAVGVLLLAASLGALIGPTSVRLLAQSEAIGRGYEPLMWIQVVGGVLALVALEVFMRVVTSDIVPECQDESSLSVELGPILGDYVDDSSSPQSCERRLNLF